MFNHNTTPSEILKNDDLIVLKLYFIIEINQNGLFTSKENKKNK